MSATTVSTGTLSREDFVVRVEDRSALGEDRLLDDVFFSREPRVLVVLDHLQIDQAKRKEAEEENEAKADRVRILFGCSISSRAPRI